MPNNYLILYIFLLLTSYVIARGPGGPGGWAMGRVCKRDCSVDCFSIAPYKCLQGTGKLGGVKFSAIEFVHGTNYQNQWTLAAFNDSQNCNATTAVFAYPLLVATSCLNISLIYNDNEYSFLYIEGPAPPENNSSTTDEPSYTQTGLSNDTFPIIFAIVPLILIVISLVVVAVAVVKAIKRNRHNKSEEEEDFDLVS